jgi:hypothetical protein
MTKPTAVIVKTCAVSAVLLIAWIGIRLLVAERNAEPSYTMTAGTDYIRQEWGYCTRFENETRNRTGTSVLLTRVNNSLFMASRPIFWLENKVFGKRIDRGATYDQYMGRVREVRSRDWDYVISSHPDGRELYAVKNNSIIQKVD